MALLKFATFLAASYMSPQVAQPSLPQTVVPQLPLQRHCLMPVLSASTAPNGEENEDFASVPPLSCPLELPSDSFILQEPDEAVWTDETLEYSGLLSDPLTPQPLRSYLCSFMLPSGIGCHAFAGGGATLANFNWQRDARGDQPLDADRTRLILDTLSAVSHLHSRGCAHLDLNGDVLVVRRDQSGSFRLVLLGLGATVRLQSTAGRTAFQMGASVSFHAPETLSGALIQSNLRALLLMDAWSVGVIIAMIAGGLNCSPFNNKPDWARGEFSAEAATRRAISDRLASFGPWLSVLNEQGGGFLFRNGWVIQLIIGFLTPDPAQRLFVPTALGIGSAAIDANVLDAVAPKTTSTIASAPGQTSETAVCQSTGQQAGATEAGGAAAVAVAAAAAAAAASTGPTKSSSVATKIADGVVASRDLSRFRNLGAETAGEPFRSLEAMINIAERGQAKVLLERRRPGIKNYGEVIGFRNRADGDRWDIFVPGVKQDLPIGQPIPLLRVLGLVLIKGGNHKLAVELAPPYGPVCSELVSNDIRDFIRAYSQQHRAVRSRIKYLELEDVSLELAVSDGRDEAAREE
eukprot:CAMPEP_0119313220 /NCGR_PEP_ID=MMETSP1333-20130426/28304_1 /TAXON_ID=418940 /ORGANISM="Scyphosphaera apsteinii, Strain RCC1455" /LENGTH=576 /DNA_ID=CAMNT_0007318007 /DNA_START=157 /DNA_END=1887 /DNA_ORIENTATION=+